MNDDKIPSDTNHNQNFPKI